MSLYYGEKEKKYYDCLDRIFLNELSLKKGNSKIVTEQLKKDYELKAKLENEIDKITMLVD